MWCPVTENSDTPGVQLIGSFPLPEEGSKAGFRIVTLIWKLDDDKVRTNEITADTVQFSSSMIMFCSMTTEATQHCHSLHVVFSKFLIVMCVLYFMLH